MKGEAKDSLLRETLAGEELADLRRRSLEILVTAARRRAHLRRMMRAGLYAALPVLLAGAVLAHWHLGRKSPPTVATLPPASPAFSEPVRGGPASGVEFITDEQLFALFPGRPLALIGAPGRQQLVFLDQAGAAR